MTNAFAIGFDEDTFGDDQPLFFGVDQDFSVSYDSTEDNLVVTDEVNNTELLEVEKNGPVVVPNSDLRLATGQSIEDGNGFPVITVNSKRPQLIYTNSAGIPSNFVRDATGSFNAVNYINSSTVPGTLELTNAELDMAVNSIRRASGVELTSQVNNRYRPGIGTGGTESQDLVLSWRDTGGSNGQTLLRADIDESFVDFSLRSQDLRLATGQAIEDGGGGKRFNLYSGADGGTVIADDTGQWAFEARNGQYNSIRAYSGTPFKIRDREGAYTAVRYDADASAPGTLELTNAQLHVPIPSAGIVARFGDLNEEVTIQPNSVLTAADSAAIYFKEPTNFTAGYIYLKDTGELEARDDAGNTTVLT